MDGERERECVCESERDLIDDRYQGLSTYLM